jgi:hypothetical protein
MAIEIRTIQHSNYLEFVVTGSHDLGEAIDRFAQVLAACRSTGQKKVLVDYRQLTYPVGATEKALYAMGAENQYLQYLQSGGHELQIAYLAPVVSSFEPGADIGREIDSLRFELFRDLDEALEWLGVEST